MLKLKDTQMSFLDPIFACNHLILNYFHRFREAIVPLVKEEDYAYVGRPAMSPASMNLVLILQSHLGFVTELVKNGKF